MAPVVGQLIITIYFSIATRTRSEQILCDTSSSSCSCDSIADTSTSCDVICDTSDCNRKSVLCLPAQECTVLCSGSTNCKSLEVQCGDAVDCTMVCSGANSCQHAVFNCNDAAHCSLLCTGGGACQNVNVAVTSAATQSYQCIGVECSSANAPAPFAAPTSTPTSTPTSMPTLSPSSDPSVEPTTKTPTQALIATLRKITPTSPPTDRQDEQAVDEEQDLTTSTATATDDGSLFNDDASTRFELPNFAFAIIGGLCVFCCLAAIFVVHYYRRKQQQMQRAFDKAVFAKRSSSSAKPLKAKYDIVHGQHVNVQHSMNDVDALYDPKHEGLHNAQELQRIKNKKTSEGVDRRGYTAGSHGNNALDEYALGANEDDDANMIDDIDNNVALHHQPGTYNSNVQDLDVLQDIEQMARTADGLANDEAEIVGDDEKEDVMRGNATLCDAPVIQDIDVDNIIEHINSLQRSDGSARGNGDDSDGHFVDELMETLT